jgi:hypothetical protein
MKTSVFALYALSASNVATAVKFLSGPQEWASAVGLNATEQHWDDVELPPQVIRAAAVPKRQELKSRAPQIPGSKSVKIRYGPYTVPAPRV